MMQMRRSRRRLPVILTAAAVLAPDAWSWALPPGCQIVVVSSSAGGAFAETVGGIRASVPAGCEVTVIEAGDRDAKRKLAQSVAGSPARVVITLGTEALRVISAVGTAAPVISTMVLASDSESAGGTLRPAATLPLNLPFRLILDSLSACFPDRNRIGVIRNPLHRDPPATALQAAGRQQGFDVRVVDCPGPERLLDSMRSLAGAVDFVVCFPDGSLYNAATIVPLLSLSVRRRLPVVGFSESFVRAGAAFGVFPDFADVGRQAGEAASAWLGGQPVGADLAVRSARYEVNPQVVRLLEIPVRPGRRANVVTFR